MHSPKRVGLVLHPRRDSTEAVQAILDWTRRHDATLVGLPGEVDAALEREAGDPRGRRCLRRGG